MIKVPETKKGKRLTLAGIAAAALVIFILYREFFPELDLQQLLDDFANFLGAWTYLVVGLLAFLETGAFVGLIVPGETAMLIGGAVAGQGVINVFLLIAIAWLMAFLGDSTSFWLGHRLGREFILKHGPKFGISAERYEQVEDYFEKHGGKTVLMGRFIGLVRALSPFVAGSSGMRYRAFAPYSILGSGLQITLHILAGYFFARSIEAAAEYVGLAALVIGTMIVVSVASYLAWKYLREPNNRARAVEWMEGRWYSAWLVRLARRYETQLRWIQDRFTPGGTFGLEVTTLFAIIAVASFVLFAYAGILLDDGGPTPGDLRAFDFRDLIETGWLTSIAKVVTVLGSQVVLLPLITVTAVILAVRQHWSEMLVLVLSSIAIAFGIDWIKDWVARPRPDGGMIEVAGYAYPSGHAAHSIFYVWLSVTIAVRLRPDMARKAALITGGILLAALVGLSRVYLGVHYLSDVFGGWALGALCFSFFAVWALLLGQLRKN
ncbi:MAG TPA: bifunctional DedA family/phosphatase PAP2 family protein [Solirubrobacterales bacterium]|nr:bifunctional DedA family/phosphatase PAP2 family protein [Solirubrobacterales bacterium]HNC15334.1 bifunctional DedA family/phosphatase PAP2 family protein [Solirubrobacterales bacterium]HNO97575.1 bifunctional DedA family/phosphatase PAP2 family protein [Solirubrobacterales bacterium]